MRDPERIDDFTYHLAYLWEKYCPDWRFAQLMSNFYSYYKSDLFYNEEEQFMEKFECFIYNEVAEKPDPDDFIYYKPEEDKQKMNLTNMTMEELCQMKAEVYDEIARRNKAEKQKAIKEFIEAFNKVTEMALEVTYEDWDDTYTLVNPERFHFTSL